MTDTGTQLKIQTKQHFKMLDGLRGLAAIAVVVFHFMEIAVPDYTKSFIAHAYLAVDFFFCLSGFVIAYAYDTKLADIGIWTFIKLRLIRLHPLVIIGSVIGILAFVFDPFSNLYQKYTGNLLLMFITSCLMIPYALVRERYFNNFHLNPPTWSLFWEYIANIVYALVLVRINKKMLWLLVIIAAALLVYEAHRSTNLSVGWSGDNIMGGGIRMFYSFLAGMLVYRLKWVINSRLGFIAIGLMLLVTFFIPFRNELNPIVEPIVVIFYFPFLIALGAGAQLSASSTKICKFSGDISYPLYMVHYPFIWLFMSYVEAKKPSLNEMAGITAIGTLLLIVLAYAVMKYLDEPVRKRLNNLVRRRG
ncbi:acyltransferase [Mucilaginibacter limnophilus]|uniref:Acyltransferase n=1 Tax=Mucilaginibacter limnophilus TaxID=1932778 RepID=A0A437MSJ4_9SPHI|nr:acyltransferase [Mucilaginibacter limnophilus]RVU00633.1 acyltransferase [Mucilaginibacter limnophilus]